jgi:hypothetical protein
MAASKALTLMRPHRKRIVQNLSELDAKGRRCATRVRLRAPRSRDDVRSAVRDVECSEGLGHQPDRSAPSVAMATSSIVFQCRPGPLRHRSGVAAEFGSYLRCAKSLPGQPCMSPFEPLWGLSRHRHKRFSERTVEPSSRRSPVSTGMGLAVAP